MSKPTILLLILLNGISLAMLGGGAEASSAATTTDYANTMGTKALRCVAFGPYVNGLDPDGGPHPTPTLIDSLLEVVEQTGFHCIMTYGVLNGLDYTFQAASKRGMKVIAIIWIDGGESDGSANDASIQRGIEVAKAYPETIIRLSCGSEFRTRNGTAKDSIIKDCISRVRAAGVTQPITSIDTWWQWCAGSWPCKRWDLADEVDWIGINVFPWWENKYSGLFPCTTAVEAAEFHIARLSDVSVRYSDKPVMLTEFGWPAGPEGYSETNQYTGQQCGVAGQDNQRLVLKETLAKLDQLSLPAVVFEAFREGDWKARREGPVGVFWGVCEGSPPFLCKFHYGPTSPSTDFNGDGQSDLLWWNALTGDVTTWYLNGVNSIGWDYLGHGIPTAWRIVGVADFNGDGYSDILWRSQSTGDVTVWYMNGVTQTGWAYVGHGVPTAWKIVGTADLNGDGYSDILWWNSTTGDVTTWYLSGVTQTGWAYVDHNVPLDWRIVGVADFNGDGQSDLLWWNQTTGDVTVWYLNGVTQTGWAYVGHTVPLNWRIVGPK